VEEVERNLSVVFELRSVRSIYALERSEELRPIRRSKVNAPVWKLGQSRDKPYGRDLSVQPSKLLMKNVKQKEDAHCVLPPALDQMRKSEHSPGRE
jgi:hypothetical protein